MSTQWPGKHCARTLTKSSSLQDSIEYFGTHRLEIAFLSAPKQTGTTQRWKIHLRSTDTGNELPTKIEFSRRGFDEGVAFEAVDPEVAHLHRLRPILTTHYTLEPAFAQKVEALIHRY